MTNPQPFTPPHPLNTAVLFLVFNRLDTTKQVFEAIRQAKPPRLYIAADGARETKKNEAEKVQAVRDYVIENIDWACEIKTFFRDKNLGCKYAVSSAITWFFENEDQGIVLEDDCLPSQSFFWFCEDLLNKYKNDETIYLISGDARAPESLNLDDEYSFCKYPLIWGWASWSRVWKKYDSEIKEWPLVSDELIAEVSPRKKTREYWKMVFDGLYLGQYDTWDYQFSFLLLKDKTRCIVPGKNLIENIGFGLDATHTVKINKATAYRNKYEIPFPLSHKYSIQSEEKINNFYDDKQFFLRGKFIRTLARFYNSFWCKK